MILLLARVVRCVGELLCGLFWAPQESVCRRRLILFGDDSSLCAL